MCREIWQSLGVADDHILTGNAKDNFWGESNGSLRVVWLMIRDGSYGTMWTMFRDPL
jgi:hypothetical protein